MQKKHRLQRFICTCMRIGLLPLVLIAGFAGISYANPAGGQEILERRITLSADQVEVKSILEQISRKADVKFVYSAQKIPARQIASCSAEDEKLGAILNRLLLPFNVVYEVKGNKIVLRTKQEEIKEISSNGLAVANETPVSQRPITGKITDENGQPLSGVSIKIKGASAGTSTNSDGEFSLDIPENATLVVSYVGYETKEVKAQKLETIAVRLLPAASNKLNEVVVVGYQRQSLKKTTSSVQIVSGKAIENLPAPSFDQLLQGKVSGINIQNFTGEPGVRNTFTIRGNSTIATDLNADGLDEARTMSTPLYVIDGIPVSVTDLEGIGSTGNNFLAGINVNDIESLTVQKDAAATAVWGSRGANGVVVIKTKRGRSKTPEVRASYYRGLTEKPKLLPTTIGAEERRQKMDLINEYSTYAQMGSLPQILTDSLNPAFNNATDWQDLFYQSGKIDNIDLNVSSGTETVNYRLGANYYDESGIVRNTGFKRFSLRGNFDFKINSKLNVNLNVSASRLDRKRGLGRGRNEILPINVGQMPASFYAISDDDKSFYHGQFDKLKDKNQSDLISLSVQTNYRILPALDYSFQGSYSKTNDKRERFQPSTLDAGGVSFAENRNGNFESYYLANVLSYAKSLGDNVHNFGLVGTQSFQLDQRSGGIVGGYNIPDDNIQVVSGVPQQDLFGRSYIQKSGLFSFVGQFSYDYKQKYILNLSMRGDASSRFGANTKWGYFPSVSLAYVVSDEKFMDKIGWINLFKLRGSYGLTGTMPDNFYAPFNVWDLAQGTYNGIVRATPSFDNPLTQPDLTWNKSDQLNVGADLNMFDNRINLSVDLYRRYNSNPILSFPFPFFTGYTQATYNAPVKILNEGVDIQLQTRNLAKSSPLQWTTNFNIGYNKNRIAALPNGNRSFYRDSWGYNQSLVYSVGAPIYGWAQMLYTGVYNRLSDVPVNPYTGQRLSYFKKNYPVSAGYPMWTDVNNDWDVWSDEDRGEQYGDLVPTGDPNPKFTGGIYNEFTYGNFSLGVQCIFTLGRDIINTFDANQFAGVWNFSDNGTLQDVARFRLPDLSERDYWTPGKADPAKNPGYAANFPSLSPFGPNYYQFLPFSTMWNENGNYFKIRNISLGYQVPEKILSRVGIKRARLYSIIDNIYVFQKANVPDAELVSPQGEYRGGSYPLPRKYTLGLEVTF
ncbi:SusC/RagA family TonB-linked outer membrane protein [Terrimonas pollutisoli]|uniref:SusC/RagA family TonB-linked outer membrane protein n=1 Tax=Terrimonas pollutisoli TaxID=3034147 RepID=UPI0023ED1D96|nr:SusC/RagA family TonB-linked outer membrane protein [Terrimonas sp. H1YJ31]